MFKCRCALAEFKFRLRRFFLSNHPVKIHQSQKYHSIVARLNREYYTCLDFESYLYSKDMGTGVVLKKRRMSDDSIYEFK